MEEVKTISIHIDTPEELVNVYQKIIHYYDKFPSFIRIQLIYSPDELLQEL